jgi:hypothetical protein
MRIGFLFSSKGGSPMLVGLQRGMKALGHQILDYKPHASYDLLLVFNQVAHTIDYEYPEFSETGPVALIDCAEYGYFKRLPEFAREFRHSFTLDAVTHDTKNTQQQLRLKQFLDGKSYPYLLREFHKAVDYPQGFHPIDYPLYMHSECAIKPNREEYLARSKDLFVSWGASHPWRVPLTHALRTCPLNSTVLLLEENGTPRMPQRDYFERQREAKVGVSYDGYGSSSFRLTEVLVRSTLLMGPLWIKRHAPLIDGVHCVEYTVSNMGQEFTGSDICEKLQEIIANPERGYEIYERGYRHCYDHYTETATAQYVLDTVAKHDWQTPTNV